MAQLTDSGIEQLLVQLEHEGEDIEELVGRLRRDVGERVAEIQAANDQPRCIDLDNREIIEADHEWRVVCSRTGRSELISDAVLRMDGVAKHRRLEQSFIRGRILYGDNEIRFVEPFHEVDGGGFDWMRDMLLKHEAGMVTMLRRLCFDLTGLPPSLKQVKQFEALSPADGPAAYKALVDDLLKSPRFGEHWARHWLDGIRYDPQLETSAFYRNWVIQAFNSDMPYNEFVRMQIAGDLLPSKNKQFAAANVIATQMLAYNRKEADFVEASMEVIGQQMLGISFNCAKCHDHKYDAISQEDYYALAGILTSSRVPKSARDGVTIPGTKTKIVALFEEKANRIGPTHLLLGGDKSRRGKLIPRRLPTVFFENEPPRIVSSDVSGRLELANWVGDHGNPLTARVMANRIWQRLMGRGIVMTPNDFGTNGDAPTHPRLLDYLASRLIESGWSVKSVLREIALSRTYRQSVAASKDSFKKDHSNALYTRAIPKRLQFEQIMDQLLAVAGRLELGVVEPVSQINKWPKHRHRDKTYGGPRTIYVRADDHAKRTFDGPNPELLVVERARSVTALQALLFLNGEMVRKLAEATAKSIPSLGQSTDRTAEIDNCYRVLFARLPGAEEKKLGREFIAKYGLPRYVHTLMCTNEFLHLN